MQSPKMGPPPEVLDAESLKGLDDTALANLYQSRLQQSPRLGHYDVGGLDRVRDEFDRRGKSYLFSKTLK